MEEAAPINNPKVKDLFFLISKIDGKENLAKQPYLSV